jgi:hypothetical protein
MKAADDKGYLLGGGTRGSNNDANSCGTINLHAYTIISVFTLNHNSQTYNMLMVRNPWDVTSYNQEWS